MSESVLVIYVVYENPSDYPGQFVLKRDFCWQGGVQRDPDFVLASDDYKQIEDLMQKKGLYKLERMTDDDVAIKETWL